MSNSLDLTTILFLAMAVFVIWRLRSVLGQKTGSERPPSELLSRHNMEGTKSASKFTSQDDNVVPLKPGTQEHVAPQDRWKGIAETGSSVAQGLDSVAAIEPDFNAKDFLEGAKSAYEMIVTGFSKGDRKTLKNLLSKEVYEGFEQAIDAREKQGHVSETTFVSLDQAQLIHVEVKQKTAHMTVKFVSKLITVTRDTAGQVVDGSPEAIIDVTDTWTFARTLGSRDPNWLLVATEEPV